MWLVFSVYDNAAKEYGQLYLARNATVAARMFTDAIIGPQETVLRLHPEDFELHELGEFNEQNALLVNKATGPESIISATEVLRRHDTNQQGE